MAREGDGGGADTGGDDGVSAARDDDGLSIPAPRGAPPDGGTGPADPFGPSLQGELDLAAAGDGSEGMKEGEPEAATEPAGAAEPEEPEPGRGSGRRPAPGAPTGADMLSIGALASAAQGASYYERDGYYAKDDPEHRAASAWAGRGAEELGLEGPVDPETFRQVLEGRVPDGSGQELGRRGKDGEIVHRPGRDLTFSAPKSVSLAALVGGDGRIVEAHDRAVKAALGWVEKNAAETRMKDPETGRMGRVGDQKTVAATFRHDTSRNLDPQLHTHAVLANMVQGEDGKWRSMANERLYASKMLIGALYRGELAAGPRQARLRHREDPCRRALRDRGGPARDHRGILHAAGGDRGRDGRARARRVRRRSAHRRARRADDAGRQARHRPGRTARRVGETGRRSRLRRARARGASDGAVRRGGTRHGRPGRGRSCPRRRAAPGRAGRRSLPRRNGPARAMRKRRRPRPRRRPWAGQWRISRSARRCSRGTTCSPRRSPTSPGGSASRMPSGRWRRWRRRETCTRWTCPGAEDSLATDRTVGEERETVALMHAGQGRGRAPMRSWMVQGHLNRGPLTAGQRDAVKLILSAKDRVVGVQGYAGTGKTTMLNRGASAGGEEGIPDGGARAVGLGGCRRWRPKPGSSRKPSSVFSRAMPASQRAGSRRRARRRCAPPTRRTILVVDEGSLASTVQAQGPA